MGRLQVALEREDPTPGRRPMDVYDVTLPRWRAALRRRLVKTVQRESEIIAKMQVSELFLNLKHLFRRL
jgi:hypothetical protein